MTAPAPSTPFNYVLLLPLLQLPNCTPWQPRHPLPPSIVASVIPAPTSSPSYLAPLLLPVLGLPTIHCGLRVSWVRMLDFLFLVLAPRLYDLVI
jgi:hypothetical protein